MSPRAAWRLESLGFTDVYDYVAGKVDWLAAGLKSEGRLASTPAAKDVARSDVPSCGLDDTLGGVRARAGSGGVDLCAVVNDEGILLGLLRAEELDAPDDTRAEDVMLSGPSTFRPHVPITEMAEYMTKHDLPAAPITTAEGKLMGVLFLEDAIHAAHE